MNSPDTLLSPRLDIIFIKLFSEDTELLVNLINSVLELPEDRRILSVEVRTPILLPEAVTKKFNILDVRAEDNNGNKYDIEMQVQKYAAYPKRALFYVCRLYVSEMKPGEDYDVLKPTIGIHFLNYEQFPDHPDFHYHFEMKDIRYPDLRLTDDISLRIFELPKLEKLLKQKKLAGDMIEWLYFFNHAHKHRCSHINFHKDRGRGLYYSMPTTDNPRRPTGEN